MKLLFAAAVLTAFFSSSVRAEDFRSYYTVLHPEAFTLDWRAFYEVRQRRTAQVRATYPNRLDISFGPDAKQNLDIYVPKDKPENAPILIFLHGGGFSEGDRAYYGYLAEAYARHGVITVVPSYRLTSDGFHYPDPLHDVQAAIAWVHHNIAAYGGNPDNIVVSGHSAGAILAAEAGVDRGWLAKAGIPKRALRGMVLVSGRYAFPPDEGPFAAYVPTAEAKEQASPIKHIVDPVQSVIVAVGSTETAYLAPSRSFHDKLGGRSQFLLLDGANHQEAVDLLGVSDSLLFKATLALLQEQSGNVRRRRAR